MVNGEGNDVPEGGKDDGPVEGGALAESDSLVTCHGRLRCGCIIVDFGLTSINALG